MAALERLIKLPRDVVELVVVELLEQCVRANDRDEDRGTITRFHSKNKTDLNLLSYYKRYIALCYLVLLTDIIARVIQYTPCSTDAVILSLLYIDRVSRNSSRPSAVPLLPLIERPPDSFDSVDDSHQAPLPVINSYTIHRLVCASLVIASKFSSDHFVPHVRAAKVSGVTTVELVRLEVEMLKALHWRLHFSVAQVNDVAIAVLRHARTHGHLHDQVPQDELVLSNVPTLDSPKPTQWSNEPPLIPIPIEERTGEDDSSDEGSDQQEDGELSNKVASPLSQKSTSTHSSSSTTPTTREGDTKEWREFKERDRLRSIQARANSEASRHVKNMSLQSVNSITSF